MTRKTTRRKTRSRFDELIDPAPVREVRRWRAKLLKKAGGTIEGLIELCYGPQAAQRRAGRRKRA
jgi:hypothetical protein